ncbi:MAG: hypothetical protein JXK93_03260 [Sphaerochaetaceae bacterium]|nr:hypothetical protein [Sphaerochaetaceae bacterium]
MAYIVFDPDMSIVPAISSRSLLIQGGDPCPLWERILSVLESRFPPDSMFVFSRLRALLDEQEVHTDQEMYTHCERMQYRLQGTDGVRGVVRYGTDSPDPVRFFMKERVLTGDFCFHYTRGFLNMLQEEGGAAVKEVAFGEDGRDYHRGGELKNMILRALASEGTTGIDLGIVPTPYLSQYSQAHSIPAIMLTASHNPESHNGIKLFIDGRKLYPSGTLGEYRLSSIILRAPQAGIQENSTLPSVITSKIHNQIVDEMIFELRMLDASFFENTPLLVDCANGAASSYFIDALKGAGIAHLPLFCRQGRYLINDGCGVASIEEIQHQEQDILQSHPTVQALVDEVEHRKSVEGYAIVLDGDGDRAFIIRYRKGSVTVLNGDHLGYLIIRSLKEKHRVFHTIESAYVMKTVLHATGSDEPVVTCVGDRWLAREMFDREENAVGFESSGHVMFPQDIRDTEGAGLRNYSGNGMRTAVYALRELITGGIDLNLFDTYELQSTYRKGELDKFFRESTLWKKIRSIFIASSSCTAQEFEFAHEPDLLFFFLANGEEEIGWCYVRPSGTESKLTLRISVTSQYRAIAQEVMHTVTQEMNTTFPL